MTYEVVCEIFNSCANNQMRDVSFQELTLPHPEDYVRQLEKGASLDVSQRPDGTVIIDTDNCGLRKRYSFTPIF